MSNVLEEVSKEMKDSDYVSDHFMVAISVPVSLMLREHALKIRIDEITKGEFDEEEVPAVKQVGSLVQFYLISLCAKYTNLHICESLF